MFLAPDSQAEELVIDGIEVPAIVDREDCGEIEGVGVTVTQLTLLLMASALDTPQVGQELDIDGKIWTVSSRQTMSGVLELQLYRDVS